MAPFAPRYNDAQREAIYKLKRQGNSGRQIAAHCANGVIGLEPFKIGHDTANRIAREQREAQELSPLATGDVGGALEDLMRREISQLDRDLAKMERMRRPTSTMDHKRITSSLATLVDLHSKLQPKPNGNENGRANGNGREPEEGLLARLAAEADE